MYYEFEYGEEIRGVECPTCEGALVRVGRNAWCDWCQVFVPVIQTMDVTPAFGFDEAGAVYWWEDDK